MKKRWIATALAAVMAVSTLAGCGAKPEEAQAPAPAETTQAAQTEAPAETKTPAETTAQTEEEYGPVLQKAKESGKLIAAINAQSPPWRFHKMVDGQDKLCGFEISMCYGLADYVSEKLGTKVEVEINDMTFPGVLAALQAGQVDFAPSLAGTEERRQNMDFSIPYHRSLQTIVIKKDRENEDIFAPDKAMKGVSTASLQGSSTSVTFSEQYPQANLIDYESTPDIVLAVANGKVDAAVLNEKYAILICKANPDLMIDYDLSFDIPVDRDPGASIAIPKGNEDFVELVDEWLNTILSDGTFSSYEQEAIAELDDPDLLEGFSSKNILNKK
ncbi:MAG: transporter substrate-binding domain-containing protein [Hungatella sp.]|nr:transporter substrate-binding domain-containing protein [Hungatella sp.]